MIRLERPERSPRHRLLGGWRDVFEDIRTLCRTLGDLPETCGCRDGAAHLNGTCPCCGGVAAKYVPHCGPCDEQLARLRPAIDEMTVDMSRFFPFIVDLLSRRDAAAAKQLAAIDADVAVFKGSFDRLVLAAGTFRNDCRISHLRTLKDAAAALLADATNLDRTLE